LATAVIGENYILPGEESSGFEFFVLKTRPDRKEAYLEAAGGEKPDGEGKFLLEPKKVAAAKKMPPQEMVELVRQALKEVLAEEFPTLMGEDFRKKVARGRRRKTVVSH
jgi:hypothetical protein